MTMLITLLFLICSLFDLYAVESFESESKVDLFKSDPFDFKSFKLSPQAERFIERQNEQINKVNDDNDVEDAADESHPSPLSYSYSAADLNSCPQLTYKLQPHSHIYHFYHNTHNLDAVHCNNHHTSWLLKRAGQSVYHRSRFKRLFLSLDAKTHPAVLPAGAIVVLTPTLHTGCQQDDDEIMSLIPALTQSVFRRLLEPVDFRNIQPTTHVIEFLSEPVDVQDVYRSGWIEFKAPTQHSLAELNEHHADFWNKKRQEELHDDYEEIEVFNANNSSLDEDVDNVVAVANSEPVLHDPLADLSHRAAYATMKRIPSSRSLSKHSTNTPKIQSPSTSQQKLPSVRPTSPPPESASIRPPAQVSRAAADGLPLQLEEGDTLEQEDLQQSSRTTVVGVGLEDTQSTLTSTKPKPSTPSVSPSTSPAAAQSPAMTRSVKQGKKTTFLRDVGRAVAKVPVLIMKTARGIFSCGKHLCQFVGKQLRRAGSKTSKSSQPSAFQLYRQKVKREWHRNKASSLWYAVSEPVKCVGQFCKRIYKAIRQPFFGATFPLIKDKQIDFNRLISTKMPINTKQPLSKGELKFRQLSNVMHKYLNLMCEACELRFSIYVNLRMGWGHSNIDEAWKNVFEFSLSTKVALHFAPTVVIEAGLGVKWDESPLLDNVTLAENQELFSLRNQPTLFNCIASATSNGSIYSAGPVTITTTIESQFYLMHGIRWHEGERLVGQLPPLTPKDKSEPQLTMPRISNTHVKASGEASIQLYMHWHFDIWVSDWLHVDMKMYPHFMLDVLARRAEDSVWVDSDALNPRCEDPDGDFRFLLRGEAEIRVAYYMLPGWGIRNAFGKILRRYFQTGWTAYDVVKEPNKREPDHHLKFTDEWRVFPLNRFKPFILYDECFKQHQQKDLFKFLPDEYRKYQFESLKVTADQENALKEANRQAEKKSAHNLQEAASHFVQTDIVNVFAAEQAAAIPTASIALVAQPTPPPFDNSITAKSVSGASIQLSLWDRAKQLGKNVGTAPVALFGKAKQFINSATNRQNQQQHRTSAPHPRSASVLSTSRSKHSFHTAPASLTQHHNKNQHSNGLSAGAAASNSPAANRQQAIESNKTNGLSRAVDLASTYVIKPVKRVSGVVKGGFGVASRALEFHRLLLPDKAKTKEEIDKEIQQLRIQTSIHQTQRQQHRLPRAYVREVTGFIGSQHPNIEQFIKSRNDKNDIPPQTTQRKRQTSNTNTPTHTTNSREVIQ